MISGQTLEHIQRGSLIHDIGKIGIPDGILTKPGPLNPEERAIIEQHPLRAQQMLENIAFLRPALEIPIYHHERWDDSGYPNGLEGEEIPLSARIFAVVDVWDALTHDRPYQHARPTEEALTYIESQAGKYFDPKMPQVFLEFIQAQTDENRQEDL